jgi:hypothetical protein
MFAQKSLISHLGRTAMIAGVAAIGLTAVEPSLAVAGPVKEKGLTAATATSGATDFSAQRRFYRRGGGAAAAAAFAGIVGTGIAIAASRPYYYDSYAYYGGPPVAYYGGPPVAYYGGPGYYGGYGYGGYYPNGGRYVGGYDTGQYW